MNRSEFAPLVLGDILTFYRLLSDIQEKHMDSSITITSRYGSLCGYVPKNWDGKKKEIYEVDDSYFSYEERWRKIVKSYIKSILSMEKSRMSNPSDFNLPSKLVFSDFVELAKTNPMIRIKEEVVENKKFFIVSYSYVNL